MAKTFINIKAELLQLNRTQFSSMGIFISKKVGNRKTTFIISVLKVVYLVVLVFRFPTFLLIRIPREEN
jgi:predicted MFS family arabinose efflux permease